MKKVVVAGLAIALVAGVVMSAWFVDGMAVRYLTAQRRVPGRGFFGEEIPQDGPVPGTAFLGFSRPSTDPPGMRIVRPFESGREIGLEPGDVVTSVDGMSFASMRDLMDHLVKTYQAGDVVTVTAVSDGDAPRDLSLKLRALIRTPADLELAYEDVEIRSESGNLLRGWFIPPPQSSDGRMVVFVHGLYSSRYQALEHGGKFWHYRGYGLLTMDLSGHGESEGKYVRYTLDERKDVASMVRWARKQEGIDPDKVVVFGTSNGAAAAIYAAADGLDLPALALDAPYADLWDAAGVMLKERGGHPWLRYPLSVAIRFRAGIDLESVRPVDVITEIRAPVLFVHGDADRRIPLEHSERMHQARLDAHLPSQLWVLPGGEHGFDNYPPEGIFWNRILDFFDRALGGAPAGWEIS